MKKFTSILCALMVMLSVNAAPQLNSIRPAKDAQKSELKQNVTVEKVAHQAVLTEKQAISAGNQVSVNRAPKAVMENIAVTATQFSNRFYAADNDAYYQLVSNDYKFYFDIVVADGLQDVELGHTYTLDDMLTDYSYMMVVATSTELEFTAASFVRTLDATTGEIRIEANVTADDGNVYNVVYSYIPATPGDTVDIAFTTPMSMKYFAEDGDWYLSAKQDAYQVALDVVNNDPTTPAGTYATEDFLLNYTKVSDGQVHNAVEANAVVTQNGSLYVANAYLTDEDGVVWHVSMSYQAPEVEYHDTIVADNLSIDALTYMGFLVGYTVKAENDEYAIEFSIDADTAGVYPASGTITDLLTGDEANTYSGNITLSYAPNGTPVVTGSVLCDDNTLYELNLTYVMPEPTRNASLTMASAKLYDGTANGVFQLYGFDEAGDTYITIALNSNQLDGTYTLANIYSKEYCYIAELGADTLYFTVADLNVTVATAANGDVRLTGTMLCVNDDDRNDVPLYTLDITYVKPTASRQVTVTIPEAKVTDATASQGVWQIAGFNADQTVYLSVTAHANQLAGTYTFSDVYGDYTYVAELSATDTAFFAAVDADFTVTVAADNTITVAGTILFQSEEDATDIPEYTFTMTADGSTAGGMEYDSEDEDYVENFLNYDIVIEEDYQGQHYNYIELYGVVYVEASNANDATILMEFNVGKDAEGLTLGTYTINDTEAVGTVTASPGVQNNSVYPSYAGYVDDEGYLTVPLWFMEEGTVTVTNGSIVVNAKNSYGRTIRCKLGNAAGVEETENATSVKVEKIMRNGQLIIRANGVEYNAQGAEL